MVSGSIDGQFWTELHGVSNSAVTWTSDELSKQFELPANATPVRYLKFQPLASNSTYEWRVGLHELEYFVEATALVNIRKVRLWRNVGANDDGTPLLRVPKKIKWLQGWTHGWNPPGMAAWTVDGGFDAACAPAATSATAFADE